VLYSVGDGKSWASIDVHFGDTCKENRGLGLAVYYDFVFLLSFVIFLSIMKLMSIPMAFGDRC